MKRQSIRVKLTMLVALFVLATVTILGLVLALVYSRDTQQRLVSALSKELEIVSYAVSAGLEFSDTKTVEDAVSLLRNVKEFVEIKVLTQDGKIFVDRKFVRPESRVDRFTVTAPVFNEVNVQIGMIEAVATGVYFKNEVKNALGMVLIVTLLVTLLALFVVAVSLRKFLTPLVHLKEAIDQVSQHGYIGQVDVVSDDEVGELAKSFNAMSESLHKTTVSRDELVKEMDERRRAEVALKESKQQLEDIINFFPDPTFVVDKTGMVIAWNKGVEKMTGVKGKDILGKGNYEHSIPFYGERRPVLLDLCIRGASHEEIKQKYPDIKQDGDILVLETFLPHLGSKGAHVWAKAVPLHDANGQVSCAIETVRDITERKNAEASLRKAYEDLKAAQAQLLQSEKMASIGVLAAGVAHEINNPLGFIMSNIAVLKTYLNSYNYMFNTADRVLQSLRTEATEPVLKQIDEFFALERQENMHIILKDIAPLLEQTLGGLERVKNIVSDLKTFARSDANVLVQTDVNQIIDNAINICWNELKYKAEVTKEYGQISLLTCSAQKLEQVFINILVNAAHAIEARGTIRVVTFEKNNLIHINVMDSGQGISPENMKKIFDPFFTTKPVGQGTGLGLSVSYDIIKQHGGDIIVESDLGRGTTFTILLPLKSNFNPLASK